MTSDAAKRWIRTNWKNSWWGLIDCDRCSKRGENAPGDGPCDACPLWPGIIQNYYPNKERGQAVTNHYPNEQDIPQMIYQCDMCGISFPESKILTVSVPTKLHRTDFRFCSQCQEATIKAIDDLHPQRNVWIVHNETDGEYVEHATDDEAVEEVVGMIQSGIPKEAISIIKGKNIPFKATISINVSQLKLGD